MAVPRNRASNKQKRSRRAHHALQKRHPSVCSNCGSYHLSHAICSSCGYYKGRPVLRTEESAT